MESNTLEMVERTQAPKKRAKKAAKKKARAKRKPRQPKPQPESTPKASLLDDLGSLFKAYPPSQPEQSPSPSPQAAPSLSSSSLPTGSAETLSAEAEQLLAGVPETIGNVVEMPGGDQLPDAVEADPVAALMDSIAFEEQDVRDQVEELFEWLAEKFQSDHWKLSERQARMLGKPTAQLLNALWAKLKTRIPDILAQWCETTPGATAFLVAVGIVVIPKATKQLALSRERRRVPVKGQAAPPTPIRANTPPKPTGAAGMIHDEGMM